MSLGAFPLTLKLCKLKLQIESSPNGSKTKLHISLFLTLACFKLQWKLFYRISRLRDVARYRWTEEEEEAEIVLSFINHLDIRLEEMQLYIQTAKQK